jgi:RNA polymerase sigma factor (sigma-70 family)
MPRQLGGLVVQLQRVAQAQHASAATDGELLEAFIVRREERAFAALVHRHGPMVLNVCRRVLRDAFAAEDAFQATFLVLARKAHAVGNRDLVGHWLYRVAYHAALRAKATSQRQRLTERQVSDMSRRELACKPNGDELQPLLDEELNRLPEKYRIPLVLCELEGRTRKEVARSLGCPEGTLSSRLARARELLAGRLRKRGLVFSSGLSAAVFANGAQAALPPALVGSTVRAAMLFAVGPALAAGTLSPQAAALAEGVMRTMWLTKLKLVLFAFVALALLGTGIGALLQAGAEPPGAAKAATGEAAAKDKAPRIRSCILLWMSGGPSQIDTFDVKANASSFKEINTAVPGIKISENLPKLAKLMDQMVIIRSLTHGEGDHSRATYLMHTGHRPVDGIDYPTLGSLLSKELAKDKAELPGFVSIAPLRNFNADAFGPGFLGSRYAPLIVGERQFGQPVNDNVDSEKEKDIPDAVRAHRELVMKAALMIPDLSAFQEINKDRAEAMRQATSKAFNLNEEKAAVRDAYGWNLFGQSCLLARRLVERQVPFVEVCLPGWDTHSNNDAAVKALSRTLDSAWASLMSDLKERGLLDSTLIVCVGEFGRTPALNNVAGRDHWARSFAAVLAGGGIKGGQVIGKTNDDGTQIDERPVSPAELIATICQALGVDYTRTNKSNLDREVPLVEKGTQPIKEVLAPDKPQAEPEKKEEAKKPALGFERLKELVGELLKMNKTDEEIIEALCLATIARFPTAGETKQLVQRLKKEAANGKARKDLLEDVAWAYLNCAECVLHLKSIQEGKNVLADPAK